MTVFCLFFGHLVGLMMDLDFEGIVPMDGVVLTVVAGTMGTSLDHRMLFVWPLALASTVLAAAFHDYTLEIAVVGGFSCFLAEMAGRARSGALRPRERPQGARGEAPSECEQSVVKVQRGTETGAAPV